MEELYRLHLKAYWRAMRGEHVSFWMICGYLFVEYVRPQSIVHALDVLPWAKLFLIGALITAFGDPNRRWVRDPTNVWLTLFGLVLILASVTAIYPDVSWQHWFDFFGWFLIYFLIINIVNSERRLFIFLSIFLLASFKISLFEAKTWAARGFAFTKWGLMGPPGFFENSGELAIQMLMFSPIALYAALFLRPYISKLKFYFLLLFPITGAATVIGASSRGAQIGLVYQIYRCLLKGRMSLRTLVIVGVVAWAGYAVLPPEQKARFNNIGSDQSSEQRLLYWRHGMEMIEARPLLGVGYFNFARYFQDHFPQDLLYGEAQLPHNIFIQVGTDSGITGLAVFLMILYRNYRCAAQVRKLCASTAEKPSLLVNLSHGMTAALGGFVIAGQFVTVTYYPFLWINLAMTVALLNITKQQVAQAKSVPHDPVPGALSKPAPAYLQAR